MSTHTKSTQWCGSSNKINTLTKISLPAHSPRNCQLKPIKNLSTPKIPLKTTKFQKPHNLIMSSMVPKNNGDTFDSCILDDSMEITKETSPQTNVFVSPLKRLQKKELTDTPEFDIDKKSISNENSQNSLDKNINKVFVVINDKLGKTPKTDDTLKSSKYKPLPIPKDSKLFEKINTCTAFLLETQKTPKSTPKIKNTKHKFSQASDYSCEFNKNLQAKHNQKDSLFIPSTNSSFSYCPSVVDPKLSAKYKLDAYLLTAVTKANLSLKKQNVHNKPAYVMSDSPGSSTFSLGTNNTNTEQSSHADLLLVSTNSKMI